MSEGGGAVVSHWRKAGSSRETNLAVMRVVGLPGLRDGLLLIPWHSLLALLLRNEKIQGAALCLTDADQRVPPTAGTFLLSLLSVFLPVPQVHF